MEIYAKYVGGGFYFGIPARDLTKDEFNALDKGYQALILSSPNYIILEPQPKKKVEIKES